MGRNRRVGEVVDVNNPPLMPCTEKRARLLLKRRRAVVCKVSPFTIRIKDRTLEDSVVQPLRLKIDPGARTTGMAVVKENDPDCGKVVLLAEIKHKRGIKESLDARKNFRNDGYKLERGRRRIPLRPIGGGVSCANI